MFQYMLVRITCKTTQSCTGCPVFSLPLFFRDTCFKTIMQRRAFYLIILQTMVCPDWLSLRVHLSNGHAFVHSVCAGYWNPLLNGGTIHVVTFQKFSRIFIAHGKDNTKKVCFDDWIYCWLEQVQHSLSTKPFYVTTSGSCGCPYKFPHRIEYKNVGKDISRTYVISKSFPFFPSDSFCDLG